MVCKNCKEDITTIKNCRKRGMKYTCKKCGLPIITKMARTVGFWTPVEDWSKLKIEFDHEKRKEYSNGDFSENGEN